LNVAVTDVLEVTVTEHAPVPVHAPDHPAKLEPEAGVAVSVTAVPVAKDALQTEPQLIPAGLLVIVPEPVPACDTLSTGSVALALNVAVTAVLAERVKVHSEVPVHAPDHPANVEPVLGAAVRVTVEPLANDAEQVPPQSIPAGLLVTVPEPLPASVTVRIGAATFTLNVAVTDVFAFSVNTHEAVPVQAPDHPANVDPAIAVAVRVTFDPAAKSALQLLPQLIPVGALVTVPEPVPARETLSTGRAAAVLNVAVAEVFALNDTVHVPVPLQAPDQPANVDPEAGVAVRVTEVPLSKEAEQVEPQLMPDGLLVIVPAPVPLACTLT
jgi:hypothetical protein